jgi:hypothetical protein
MTKVVEHLPSKALSSNPSSRVGGISEMIQTTCKGPEMKHTHTHSSILLNTILTCLRLSSSGFREVTS